jgi:hypothetical protein
MKKPVAHPEKRPKGINPKAVIAMSKGGMTQSEIAEEKRCTRQNIAAILIRYGLDKEQADEYEKYQVDIVKGKLGQVILNIDSARLKKASVNNLAYAADKLHSLYRLEQGLSTANIASNVRVKNMPTEEQDALKRAVAAMFPIPKVEANSGAGPDPGKKSDVIDV